MADSSIAYPIPDGTQLATDKVGGIDTQKVVVSNLPATQPVSGTVSVSNLPATQPVSGSVSVGNFPATQPVSATALPLPTGAATAANQATQVTSLASIDTKLTAPLIINIRAKRQTLPLHRAALTAPDKIVVSATPVSFVSGQTGGSLTGSTSYGVGVVARNAYGFAQGPVQAASLSPGSTNTVMRVSIPQVAGATYYDLFVTATNTGSMQWVGSITETQRASGGFQILAVGSTTPGGTSTANQLDIGVVGNGIVYNNAIFAANTAYYFPGSISTYDPIANPNSYAQAAVSVVFSVADLRVAPALTLIPMLQNATEGGYFPGQPTVVNFGGLAGASMRKPVTLDIAGAPNWFVAVDSIAGQGASVSIYPEPY